MKITGSGVTFAVDASLVGSITPMAEGGGFDAALTIPEGTRLLGEDASGYVVAVELDASQVDATGEVPRPARGSCEVAVSGERPCVPFRVRDGVREHMASAEGSGVDAGALAKALEIRPRLVRVEPSRVDARHIGNDPTRKGPLRADVTLDGLGTSDRSLDGMRLAIEISARQAVELRAGRAIGVGLDPARPAAVWAAADGGRPRLVEPPPTIDELASALGEWTPKPARARAATPFGPSSPTFLPFGRDDSRPVARRGQWSVGDARGGEGAMSLDDMIGEVL